MEAETNYFAYCLDTETKINYFIVPSEFLKPRPKATNLKPGVAWVTLGQHFWGAVFQSAWHESLEVDPEDGSFLDNKAKTDKDFEHLLTEAEYKECLVLATASSIQELQQYVQTCNIKVPKKYKRLDESVASGSRQQDKPEQQNKRFRSTSPANFSEYKQKMSYKDFSMVSEELNPESTGANPFVTPEILKDIEMKEPNESHDVSENAKIDDTHIRPEGKANLGFFESEIDGRVTRQNADNVCVLVIHYDFKNDPMLFRNGDACDVENLKTSFGKNRNCNFRDLWSPKKNILLHLLGDEEKLLQFFNTQDDVPTVFVLFILSHGTVNGKIWTNYVQRETNEREYLTTDEVFDSLKKLKKFDKCLKLVNFGPCRGSLNDSKFNIKNDYKYYENKNSCRITTRPGMHNYVVFFSTVETSLQNADEYGSWFIRNICTCLNSADDEPLLKFLTIVQNRMHQTSRIYSTFDKNISLGQTPELKMFKQDRKFIISKAKIAAKPSSNSDGSGTVIKVSNDIFSGYYSWKSDEGQEIRGRRGFILSVVQNKQVQEMKRVLQNLDFGIRDWALSGQSMMFYFKMVSALELDVGCIMTCVFGPVCENEHKEVCVRVQKGEEVPITDILHSLVGPKNNKLIGKPKIMFVVNMEAPQTDDGRVSPNDELIGKPNNQFDLEAPQRDNIFVDVKDLQVAATNHSGWLVLILKYEDELEKLIELIGNIGEKSLQDLLDPLLTRESNSEDVVLLNSTLQYLVKFPIFPRAFVQPNFNLKKKIIPHVQMVSSKFPTKTPIEEKIDFNTFLNEAKILFEENKKSIMSSLKSNPVKDLEATYAARNSDEVSIVWLFSSVAGAGKSTVLKEMAHQLTNYCGGFKILLIPLKKYYRYLFDMPANNVNEVDFLSNTTCNSHDDINNWIEKREVIVFLDGFDEVCLNFREKILQVVIALNSARVPLFVGTRPHKVHHIQDRIKNSTIVEIEPLDEAKQIEFLQIVAQKKQEEIKLLRKIFKDQDILGNPLYLTLLAEYNGDGNLYDIFDTIVRRKVELCLKKENGSIDVGEEAIENSLKFIQLVASRFLTGIKIDQGSVTKEALEKINAFGVVTYCNDRVDFTHQTFAGFLTAQKFIYDLKNPVAEEVPLFNDELVQCRKFVELFFSTEKGMNVFYAEAFMIWVATSTNRLNMVRQICGENLREMFKFLNPADLSLKDNNSKNALHFALRHLEMVKLVHERNSRLATETTNDEENCLHLAIIDEECSEEVAIWLLKNTDVDKNAETSLGDTPLLLAGARQKWEVTKQLVYTNVEVEKLSADGKSILHYAVKSNKLDLVQALLDTGSNVNLNDNYGVTALHLAARTNKNSKILKILLQRGAKVNAQDKDKQTALHYAAKSNEVTEVIQKLLEFGADVNSQDEKGKTALHLAARSNKNPEIVKILLEKGAKVNAQDNKNWTALHLAARYNPVSEIVQSLIENGADIHSQDVHGSTAFHLAAGENPNQEIMKILLENDAKVNARDNDKWTALHYAARYNSASEIVQMLLENGADIDSQTQDGSTALHLAAGWNKNPELVQILLYNGAKVNLQVNKNRTALHYAAEYNEVTEIVQKLLEYGADVHSKDQDGRTSLHIAAWFNKNPDILKILLDKGANINGKDNYKWTALLYAARFNPAPEVVQKLLENGAEINVENFHGETALFLAGKHNQAKEVVEILLDHGAEVNEMIRNDEECSGLLRQMKINPEILKLLK